MARLFYYPFKKHNDEVSTEKNRTALEEFLNNLQFNDGGPIGGGDHLDGSGPPAASLGRDGDIYFDKPNADIWYKDPINGWELWLTTYSEDQIDTLVAARVRWRNLWVQQLYEQNDMVRDGAYTMIANVQTTDKAAPVPVSGLVNLYPDNPLWTDLDFTGSITSGTRLTPPADRFFEVSAIRVWIPDNTSNAHYQVIIIDLNTGLFTVSSVFDGDILAVPGWLSLPIDPVFIGDNDDIVIALISANSAADTLFDHPWVYTGTSQAGGPGLGNTNRTNQQDVIRIDKIDDDGADQSAQLASVLPDSTIRVAEEANLSDFFEYIVIANTDLGAYHEFNVSLINTGLGGPGVGVRCTVNFVVPIPLPAAYVQILNQWVSDPNIQGYTQFNGIIGGTFDEHGYGVDVTIQEFSASDDWDLVAVSGGSGGGGSGGEGPAVLQQLEAWPTGPTHIDAPYSVALNVLTVPSGRGVIMDSWSDPEDIPVVVGLDWIETAIDFGLVTTRHTSFVYIDSAGTVQFDIVSPDPALLRTRLYLGRVFHNTADGTLGDNFRPYHPIPNAISHTLHDFILAVGGAFLFNGAEVDPNADLTFATNDQQWFSPGESWQQDRDDPNIANNPGSDPQPFTYIISDNTQPGGEVTLVDPASWESPLGTISAVGLGINTTTIQRLYAFIDGSYAMAYGQTEYANLEDALLHLSKDIQDFVAPDYIFDEAQIALVAYFIMERGATDLSDGTDVIIINDERLPIGGGGSAAHSHDATYLKLSGGVMAGAINMADFDLYGINIVPAQGSSAISLDYLNAQSFLTEGSGDGRYLKLDTSNNPLTGNLDIFKAQPTIRFRPTDVSVGYDIVANIDDGLTDLGLEFVHRASNVKILTLTQALMNPKVPMLIDQIGRGVGIVLRSNAGDNSSEHTTLTFESDVVGRGSFIAGMRYSQSTEMGMRFYSYDFAAILGYEQDHEGFGRFQQGSITDVYKAVPAPGKDQFWFQHRNITASDAVGPDAGDGIDGDMWFKYSF